MKTITCTILIWLALVLAGCAVDPVGMTSRAQIHADMQTGIAEQERLARQFEAEQERIAAEAAASASVEIARQETYRSVTINQAWSTALIVLAGLLVAGGLTALYINWRGRLAYVQMGQRLPQLDVTGSEPALTTYEFKQLGGRNLDIVRYQDSGQWYGVSQGRLLQLVDFDPERGV